MTLIFLQTIATPAVKYLNHLSCLQLQNNNLKQLPVELWRLTSLEELNLGYNKLVSLPNEIGLLTNLRELFLHSNELEEIPSEIGRLTHLTVLDLTNNKLEYLPGELLDLELWKFWIDGNPFNYKNNYPSLLSLKAICAQTIGAICLTDEESKAIAQESLPVTMQQELFKDASYALSCSICSSPIYHSDPFILHNAYLFKACSQACLFEIKKIKLK